MINGCILSKNNIDAAAEEIKIISYGLNHYFSQYRDGTYQNQSSPSTQRLYFYL